MIFVSNIDCGKLVFGCPRNLNMREGDDENIAISFLANWRLCYRL